MIFYTGTGTNSVITTNALDDVTINHLVSTPSGTTVKLQANTISPKLYFSFVKSKLTKVEMSEVKKRLGLLQMLADSASDIGQRGLMEDIEKQMYVLIRDQEAAVCGFSQFVLYSDIQKFRYRVESSTIAFTDLKNYSRSIPTRIRNKIKVIQDKKIFDSYHVLYNDLVDTPSLKTTSEKVKEKDPILFGRFKYDEDRYFYLLDWVDEYCDLTFKSFVQELKKDKVQKDYVHKVTELTIDDMESIKNRVTEREKTVENTNSSNWKEIEKLQKKIEELESINSELKKPTKKERWFKFF